MKRARFIPLAVIAALAAAFLIYTGEYYHASDTARAMLESDGAVKVIRTDYGWRFDGPSDTDALIFYPGAKVEAAAYAPLLHRLAEGGMDVCLVRMPFNLAIFGVDRADKVMAEHDYGRWYLSGHSLVGAMAAFLESPAPLLRERASNALGRIGRGSFPAIEPHWADLFPLASDGEPKVRLSFIWASENIATNTPDIYGDHMAVFDALLDDVDDRVRMEAPEIFLVLGKRRPGFVLPYLDRLRRLSETDGNRVVRIHCLGAIKAATSGQAQDIGG